MRKTREIFPISQISEVTNLKLYNSLKCKNLLCLWTLKKMRNINFWEISKRFKSYYLCKGIFQMVYLSK